jgi:ABC-2 type transport system ATP-binding protein
MNVAINTHHLTKYFGTHKVVDSLDLNIPKGCVYGLLGRNGAGKSTTIKMLLGMLHPDRGRAELLGEEVSSLSPAVRSRIAYMAEGHPLYMWMKVGQMMAFLRPLYSTWNQELAERILAHFEIGPQRKISHLSHGQRAQVSLALAVAPDPELLILDDPTLGLDTVVRREFLESLIQIIQRKGRTILFSSHILGDVERVADRIGILVDGVLRVDCPTDHFKESLRKVVLEFTGQRSSIPELHGMISSRCEGHQVEMVIVNYNQEHREKLEALEPKRFEEIEMNLEDAFIAYTRGAKPGLPAFE